MFDLVMKDFRVYTKMFLIWPPLFLLCTWFIHIIGRTNGLNGITVVFILLPISNLFQGDGLWQSNVLYSSLPYRRRSLVTARYFTVWLWMITVSLLLFGWHMILAISQPIMVQLPTVLLDFCIATLMTFIALPFIIRYGTLFGVILGSFVFAGLFALIFGIIVWFDLMENTTQFMQTIPVSSGLKTGIYAACTMLLLAVVTFISHVNSVRVFEKKDIG